MNLVKGLNAGKKDANLNVLNKGIVFIDFNNPCLRKIFLLTHQQKLKDCRRHEMQ